MFKSIERSVYFINVVTEGILILKYIFILFIRRRTWSKRIQYFKCITNKYDVFYSNIIYLPI